MSTTPWGGSWTATATAWRGATGWTASPGCSATATATATWTGWTANASGPRTTRAPARTVTSGISTSTATATWTATTTASSAAVSASFDPARRIDRGGHDDRTAQLPR